MTADPWQNEEESNGDSSNKRYVLRLFVVGSTPRSASAIVNVRRVCDEHLAGQYDLEVVDVLRHPEKAVEGQVVAAPTLVRYLPTPIRRFIGDMSRTDRLLEGLGIRAA